MAKLLALDASTTAVGWAVFEDGEYKDSGVFVPDSGDWRERITKIQLWLSAIIDTHRLYNDGILAYEIASGNRQNMATHRKLGAVEWCCWDVCHFWGLRFLPVNVQQVKASGCSKNAIHNAEIVAGRPMDERHPGDEADAIGVGLAALKILKREERKEI